MELATLRHNFEIHDFQRGRALQQRQRVQSFEVQVHTDQEPTTIDLRGEVVAKTDRYQAHARVVLHPQRAYIDGDCECQEYNCAHIAALAIHYAVQVNTGQLAAPDPSAAISEWLTALPSVREPRPHRVVYVLQGQSLQVLCHQRKKNGQWRKQAQALTDALLAECQLTTDDQALIALINEHQRLQFERRTSMALEGRRGAAALAIAGRTGRLFQQDLSHPVAVSSAHSLTWHWQSLADGYRLTSSLPEGWTLLETEPVWAYGEHEAKLMPIDTTLPYTGLQALLAAPVVPKAQLEVLRQFREHLPIDLPETRPTQTMADGEFRPCLAIQRHHPFASEQVVATLNGEYQGLAVALNGETSSQVSTEHEIWQITRDQQAEQAAIDRLVEQGLQVSQYHGQPVFWAADDDQAFWQNFIKQVVPQLANDGWQVEVSSEVYHFELTDSDQISWHLDQEADGWFDLSVTMSGQAQTIPLLPVIEYLVRHPSELSQTSIDWRQPDGSTLTVSTQALRPAVETLRELAEQNKNNHIKLKRAQLPSLERLIQQAPSINKLAEQLRNPRPAKISPTLQATLRDYQVAGLQWLQQLEYAGFNGLLADDMGLGKTLQVIAHIDANPKRQTASLVVAPTSLLSNWQDAFTQFAPHLSVQTWHGQQLQTDLDGVDVVLTTFNTARLNTEQYTSQSWHYVIIDEAQYIKNHRSQAAQSVRSLQCQQLLALSGTPIENNLKELWSIFDLLIPGLLGNQRQFQQYFAKPIGQNDSNAWESLKQRIQPFILRRTKPEVASELPNKTEMVRYVALEGEQATLYEHIRLSMQADLAEVVSGQRNSQIKVLDALLKLRQVCCHPPLVDLPRAQQVQESAKLDYCLELLDKLLSDGRRVLIFSQFARMLDVLSSALDDQGIAHQLLTGQTRARGEAIDKFKSGQVPVFLISLKAGGVGLNLTEADAVIHYDPWWNPAAEQQATDRVHRIGQTKPVFIYKLIAQNSVEDKILRLQRDKQQLADQLYQAPVSKLTPDTLADLLTPLSGED